MEVMDKHVVNASRKEFLLLVDALQRKSFIVVIRRLLSVDVK